MLCPIQLSHSKAMEIEDLLGRLSDVNDSLSSSLSGASDPRSHTLARHRDILHDYTQAWARLAQDVIVLLMLKDSYSCPSRDSVFRNRGRHSAECCPYAGVPTAAKCAGRSKRQGGALCREL